MGVPGLEYVPLLGRLNTFVITALALNAENRFLEGGVALPDWLSSLARFEVAARGRPAGFC